MRRCLKCMEEYLDRYENTCPHCGFTEGAGESEEFFIRLGSILQGRYIVGIVLKARSSDIIYIGWDALFERKVQIQEYYPKDWACRKEGLYVEALPSQSEQYQEGLEQFYARSRELLRLYQENDIITYYASFQENGTAYGVMEYQKRQTLGQWLQGRTLKEEEAMDFLRKAADAVEKVHQAGGWHGMPGIDTFWVTSERNLILKDFGGWQHTETLREGQKNKGQALEETGACEDNYGLAKLFCRMITGREILDAQMLDEVLASNKKMISKSAGNALRNALSYKTTDTAKFREEMEKLSEKNPTASIPVLWIAGGIASLAVLAAAGFFLAYFFL